MGNPQNDTFIEQVKHLPINLKTLPAEQWRAWAKNLLKFTAPFLAVFFAQLALGVEPKAAALVALVSFYAVLADLFKKVNE